MRLVTAVVIVWLLAGAALASGDPFVSGPRANVCASSFDTRIQAIVNEVGWDHVLGDLQWLVAMGNRWTLYPEIHTVADSLETRLESYGLIVEQQDYNIAGWIVPNVIATQVGTVFPDSIFVICAHFDSCDGRPRADYVGADDNASGVVAVLTAARVLSRQELRCTVKYVLFSGEEQGLFGSKAWVAGQAAQGANIAGALNVDMIGWWSAGAPYDLNIWTNQQSLWLAEVEANCAASYVGMPLVVNMGELVGGRSDFLSFWEHGYASVNNAEHWTRELEFNPYNHTESDRIEYLDPAFMTKNVQVVLASLTALAGLAGSASPVDPELTISSSPSLGAFPNPFVGRVSLDLSAPGVEGLVNVEMYDLRGSLVRNVSMTLEGGRAGGYLDAVDANGAPLPTGVYLLRANTAAGKVVRRVTYIR